MKYFWKLIKFSVGLFWLAFFINLFTPLQQHLLPIGITLAIIHALEFVLFYRKLQQNGHHSITDFMQVLLFGFLHIKPKLRAPQ
ncbi:DUF1145 domain-containing protein [Paraferrimonas sp. SM1919]|uniref:DUF1145 domain-containing protein n=1 Tax=Paraferrimonas sp. SM1919 TaxID=2662263 RepID=UPI0013D1D10B|nr:DUF1145 domain-containing protein [Paraferrimonas sp. SM1919]